ncbi:MAG: tetratricopeptide repeat protein [Coriobacteriales bacterium]|nr:tetratricopeptide repeat protein [Coriobacteriales bacterium]
MNQQTFETGYAAYQAGDWANAAAAFSQAKSTGEHAGRVDHLLGNCLMKLGRFDDAAAAYAEALEDESYGMVGALSTNRGRALMAAGRLEEAVEALNRVPEDSTYATPYKAYTALAGAYRALGDVRNAGIAYRNAAIDEANPDPSGSLRKLGGCFMDLGRPLDAIESYRTALDFANTSADTNAINCDLGLAYVAANRMPEAVDAFDHATADGTFELTPEVQAAYDAARNAVATLTSPQQPSETDDLLAAAGYGYPVDPLDPTGSTSADLMPSPEDTGFFSVSEEELVNDDRRRRKSNGGKVFVIVVILVLLIAGAAGFAYFSGFGWPTQESVVQSAFTEKTNQGDVDKYLARSLNDDARVYLAQIIPGGATVNITGVNRAMSNSEVMVTAKLADGGEQSYTFSLVRDGIGWKISDINPVFTSLGNEQATLSTTPAPAPEANNEQNKDAANSESKPSDSQQGDSQSSDSQQSEDNSGDEGSSTEEGTVSTE